MKTLSEQFKELLRDYDSEIDMPPIDALLQAVTEWDEAIYFAIKSNYMHELIVNGQDTPELTLFDKAIQETKRQLEKL